MNKYEEIVKLVEENGGEVIGVVVIFDGNKMNDEDYERLSDLLDEVGYEMIDCEDEKCVLRLK